MLLQEFHGLSPLGNHEKLRALRVQFGLTPDFPPGPWSGNFLRVFTEVEAVSR
jgi:hypothetical protein